MKVTMWQIANIRLARAVFGLKLISPVYYVKKTCNKTYKDTVSKSFESILRAKMFDEEYVNQHRGKYIYVLIPGTIMLISVSIFGIFGNANIVWASIRKASLRSKCNALICFLSLCDIVHQSAHFVMTYLVLTAKNFTTLQICYWSQFVSTIGMNLGTFLMTILGLDRLFCVAFPIGYQRINKWLYFFGMISLPSIYAAWINFIGYQAMTENPEELLVCTIADAFPSWSKKIWARAMIALNLLTLLTYAAVWVTIYVRNSTFDRRIMRCLTIIVAMVVFGFFLVSLSLYIDTIRELEGEEMLLHNLFEGVLINTTIALNYVVYFICSSEYRVAFKEQLNILVCRARSNSAKIGVKVGVVTCREVV